MTKKEYKKITKKDIEYYEKNGGAVIQSEQERAVILAERVKLLFSFCADLIPDKDLLKKVLKQAQDRQSFALSAAPILGAFGMDYEEHEIEARIRKERADALLNLITTLEKTEKDRAEFKEKQAEKQKGAEQLRRILGA
jgi:hypothetical protein